MLRSLLTVVAAMAIAAPVFADDSANTSSTETTVQTTTSTQAADTQATKINLNTASVKELLKVKGINASKAKAVIAYRKKHGSFKATSEIANVKGFKKLSTEAIQAIEDQLTVE